MSTKQNTDFPHVATQTQPRGAWFACDCVWSYHHTGKTELGGKHQCGSPNQGRLCLILYCLHVRVFFVWFVWCTNREALILTGLCSNWHHDTTNQISGVCVHKLFKAGQSQDTQSSYQNRVTKAKLTTNLRTVLAQLPPRSRVLNPRPAAEI